MIEKGRRRARQALIAGFHAGFLDIGALSFKSIFIARP